MNHLKKAAIAAIIIFAIAPLTAAADSAIYVGGSIGSASLSEDFDGFNVDTDSTAFRLIAGWQINEYFSVEGGYHNFGSFEQTFDTDGGAVAVRLKADGFTLGATVTVSLGQKFALFGRAGSFFWDGDADINNVSQAQPEDTNLYIGAGAKYAISDRVSLLGDVTSYELEGAQSTVASLGFSVSF